MKIAIDIGHAAATGARGNGLEEHEECSVIARHLLQALTARGHVSRIIDFPTGTNREDLNATIREINAGDFDLSVSLHCDCSDDPAPHGAHACFVSSAGAQCAAEIAILLSELLPGRACKTVYRGNLAVLTRTNCPAVLVECGFISNAHDAKIIHEQPAEIAERIAEGINIWSKRRS